MATFPWEQVEEQRKLRQALLAHRAKQLMEANGYNEPSGRMISGHYVPSSISQKIAGMTGPMFDRENFTVSQQKAAMADAENNRIRDETRQQFVNQLQDTGAIDGSRQPPSRDQIIRSALENINHPDVGAFAAMLAKDEGFDKPRRQEAQLLRQQDKQEELDFRREQAELSRVDRGENQARDLVEKQAAQERDLAFRASDAEANRQSRRDLLQAQLDAREQSEQAKASAPPKQKPLSAKQQADLDQHDAMVSGLASATEAISKSSGKGMGWTSGVIQNTLLGGSSIVNKMRDTGTNDAVQQMTYVADEIRHGRFGASLTLAEKASAAQYLPSEHDSKEQVLAKAKGLQKLVDLNHSRLRKADDSSAGDTGSTGTSNYGLVVDIDPVKLKPNELARLEQDIAALPKGTRFRVGKDSYVKN